MDFFQYANFVPSYMAVSVFIKLFEKVLSGQLEINILTIVISLA
jgi:hypothetical protein